MLFQVYACIIIWTLAKSRLPIDGLPARYLVFVFTCMIIWTFAMSRLSMDGLPARYVLLVYTCITIWTFAMNRLPMDGLPARQLFPFMFSVPILMPIPSSLSIQTFTASQQ